MNRNFPPVYDKEKCALFALGRNAMYAACLSLGIKEGDEAITPAFDCDGSLQPFRVLGLKLRFFRSDPYSFCVDMADLKSKLTSKTKLVHIINHFGMSQNWDELLNFRKETGIPILEDNAYSLFSKIDGKPFGTFGDMAIFSLRKNLPLVDGGLLRINNPKYKFGVSKKSAALLYLSDTPSLLKIMKDAIGLGKISPGLRKLITTSNPEVLPPLPLYSEPEKGYPEWPLRDKISKEFSQDYLRPMSRLAKLQLSQFSEEDIAQIMDAKRRYYSWLVKKLCNINGVKILWPDLPEGIVPFSLSLLIESNRDLFFKKLREQYDVMVWPILPGEVLRRLEDFPDVELLGRKLLQINLPSDKVQQEVFSRYMQGLVENIYDLARKYS